MGNMTKMTDSQWIIEKCCGTGALTMHAHGWKMVTPYQGNKWKLRDVLLSVFRVNGFIALAGATFEDPGPWSRVLQTIANENKRKSVIALLKFMNAFEARYMFETIEDCSTDNSDDVLYTAQFLFLQRLSYSSKAVGDLNGKWISPGFNEASAYGIEKTDKFGQVKPMIPSLIKTLDGFKGSLCVANSPPKNRDVFTYIDPNYIGTTGYPNGALSRMDVVRMAQDSLINGHKVVMVSEAEPIHELVAMGWKSVCIKGSASNNTRFHGRHEEWLTVNPGATIPESLIKKEAK